MNQANSHNHKADSSDGGRTMPEDFEEGLGLLNNEVRPQPRNNNNFVPDYSFSSLNNNVYTADESTEMLEQQIMIDGKEVYTADRVDDLHQEDFRRSAMKEKQKKPPRKSFKDTIKSLFSRGNGVTDGSPRIIHINNKELNSQQKFMSNSVSTAKYNLFTFLPKFLYEEFSKSANVFFLFISGIQVRAMVMRVIIGSIRANLPFLAANSQYFTYIKIHNPCTACDCAVYHGHQGDH